jgi:hypothetical protein
VQLCSGCTAASVMTMSCKTRGLSERGPQEISAPSRLILPFVNDLPALSTRKEGKNKQERKNKQETKTNKKQKQETSPKMSTHSPFFESVYLLVFFFFLYGCFF